ncbi:signal transduction histidine kinase [Flagellimonas meridianipacifica]|uniref:histidine kinase n=2 Tax=Flagellimonas meridianipacifica TaxID=1080225 RepID=A0A2T0MGG1_9FLAO|nr:signal transduction histidine kinase [Allomuricauda pacifica]
MHAPQILKMRKLYFFFVVVFFSSLLVAQEETSNYFDPPVDTPEEEILTRLDSLKNKLIHDYYSNNFLEVLKYGDMGLQLANRIDNLAWDVEISKYTGSALIRIKDTLRAEKTFTESLKKAKIVNDSTLIADAYNNLGNLNNEIGQDAKAIAYYNEALKVYRAKKNVTRVFVIHFNLSDIYLDQENVAKSKQHVAGLDKYLDSIQIPLLRAGYYFSKGRLALLEKDWDKAIEYFDNDISLSKKHDYTDGLVEGYEFLIEAYVGNGDYEQAYLARKESDEYVDKKHEIEKAAAINEVIARMNVNQYKQELKAKELENEMNRQTADRNKTIVYITLAASVVLLIFVCTMFLSFKRRKALVRSLQETNVQYLDAKKKAEELSEVKTNFLSAISHELRTPLYGIIGIASILKQEKPLAKYKEDITSLKFSADYLLALINDLLFLNKLDALKNRELENKPFHLRKLVRNITNSMEHMRAKNNNQFEIEITDDIPEFLKGDYVKLSQILINLISNACKFTEEGTITVSITPKEIRETCILLDFKIADTGMGISEEKQRDIFDEFTQDMKSNDFQGTGLGLAIVKRLLDLHDATIELKSEKNVGTEFSFTICYEVTQKTEIEEVPKEETIDRSIVGSHILIVDDNKINRLVTRKILEKNKFTCTIAENGKEALEIINDEVFDMILMDVNMPIMNGFEATREIRGFNSTVPIIALTATDPTKSFEDLKGLGFTDLIIKPYDTADFLEVIKKNFVSTVKI